MSTKRIFLSNLVEKEMCIDRIISWSLDSVPDALLTDDTCVLLPKAVSLAFVNRANGIGYSPENIFKSYDRCRDGKLKLFDEHITKSVIFLSNGDCLVFEYLPDRNGHDNVVKIIATDNCAYQDEVDWFDNLWNSSSGPVFM